MSSIYLTPIEREAIEKCDCKKLILNAWNVQNIVYELIVNYMLSNDPQDLGFNFTQKFSLDETKNQLYIDIAYNWKKSPENKRPAIFIERGEVEIKHPTMGGTVGVNVKESEEERLILQTMPIIISCIGTNLGLTEMLAEYVKQPILYFRTEVKNDFKLREFKLKTISKPMNNVVEPNTHFVIQLEVLTSFDEGWVVKGDHLKLKTVSREIFDKITEKPLTGQ